MALAKRNYIVPLGVGIDTKTDDKQLDVGKLLLLENATFQKIGKLKKRFGYDQLNNITLAGTTLTDNKALLINSDELLRVSDQSLYSYLNSGQWIDKGLISQVGVTTLSVARSNLSLSQAVSAHAMGITAYAWYDGTNVKSTVIDQADGQVILADYTIATGTKPFLIATSTFIYLYYAKAGNTLAVRRLSPLIPDTWGAEIALTTSLHADNYFDFVQFGTNSLSFVYKSVAGNIVTGFCKITGDIANPLDGYPSPVTFMGDTVDNCVAVQVYHQNDLVNDGIYAFYHNNTSGLNVLFYNTALSNSPTPTVIDPTSTVVRNITSFFLSASQLQVYYELNATNVYDRLIWQNTVTNTGTVGTPSVLLRSVVLCSKPFLTSGNYYMVVGHDGNAGYLQATYFLVDTTGRVVNKFNADNGGSATNPVCQTSGIYSISTNKFIFAGLIKTQLITETNVLYGLMGVSGHILDFATTDLYDYERIGQNLHIAGGMLYCYDSINLVETGFNLYPDNLTQSVDNGSGQLVAGVREALFVYEWTDNKGQIHRSALSVPIQYTTTGGTSHVTFTVSTLRLTERKGVKGEIRIVGYTTVNLGTTFYRMTSVTAPLLNNTTIDLVTFVWGVNAGEDDNTVINNEILYTTGGVLENIQPPSCTVVETYGNRLFLAGTEDENEIWYSKEYVKGEAIAFNDSFVIRADKEAGRITGLATMDDKLLIFKANAVLYIAGLGPVDTGANNDFQTPLTITIDTGCTENKSLVRTPIGIIFKSAKGIYLLARDLSCEYIGAEVEEYNNDTVVDSELMQNTTQIRFVLNSGKCLIYDYYYKQWGTFTNFTDAVSAVVWQGKFSYARTTGEVMVENTSKYFDNGSFYPMHLITPWIKVNGIQGYQRIYSGLLLGTYKSRHKLQLRIYYNYEDFSRDLIFIDTATIITPTVYGGVSPYGSGGYSGTDTLYQFQFKQSIQKCDAIKFEISDVDQYSTTDDTFDISLMILEVGLKSGYNRVAVDKTFT